MIQNAKTRTCTNVVFKKTKRKPFHGPHPLFYKTLKAFFNTNGWEICSQTTICQWWSLYSSINVVYKRKMCYPTRQLCTWKQRHRKEIWLHAFFQITSLHRDIRTQTLYRLHWTLCGLFLKGSETVWSGWFKNEVTEMNL